MVTVNDLETARRGLKKPPSQKQEHQTDFDDRAQHSERLEYVRAVTGIRGEDERRQYWRATQLENWYPSVRKVTFPTVMLSLSGLEKCALLFEFYFGSSWQLAEGRGAHLTTSSTADRGTRCRGTSPTRTTASYLDAENRRRLQQIFDREGFQGEIPQGPGSPSGGGSIGVSASTKILASLIVRIDATLAENPPLGVGGAFVKLSTSSPKDSPIVFDEARRRFLHLWNKVHERVDSSSKIHT